MDEQLLKKSLVAAVCDFLEAEKEDSLGDTISTLKSSKLYDERYKPSDSLLEIYRSYHQKATQETKTGGNFPYNLAFGTVIEIFKLLKASVKVEDRTYYLKSYKQCFVASEAIDVVSIVLKVKELASTTEDSIELLNVFKRLGLIEHVVEKEKNVTNEYLFYKFTNVELDDTDLKGCAKQFVELASIGKPNIYKFKALDIDKNEIEMSKYKGKVLVVTNVACK